MSRRLEKCLKAPAALGAAPSNYYDYNIDFSRPPYYDIPDENGIEKHYRAGLNGDFVELYPKDEAQEITQKDVDDLLQDVENIELWKEKFPPCSWMFKGFIIVNLTDVTIEDAISELKTALLFQKTVAAKRCTFPLSRLCLFVVKICLATLLGFVEMSSRQ